MSDMRRYSRGFFGAKLNDGDLILEPPTLTGWPAITLAFGLIVTVQGFETARYLGQDYDARARHACGIAAPLSLPAPFR